MAFFKFAFVLSCFMVLGTFAEDCSKGEAVWCSSLRQAIKCSAVSHCKMTSWRNEVTANDSSEVCQFCEVVVKDLVDMIEQNKTEEFMEKFLTNVCDLIPSRSSSAECKILVKEGLPIFLELIKEKMDPKVVCGLLGLCKNQFSSSPISDVAHKINDKEARHVVVDDVHVVKDETKMDGPLCKECLEFVNKAREALLSQETEKKVIEFVEKYVCGFLIFGKEECKDLTEKIIPKIFDSLRTGFDPKKVCSIFCSRISYWREEDALLQSAVMAYRDSKVKGVECEACKFFVDSLKNKLSQTQVENSVSNFTIKHVCPMLGKYSDDCVAMVQQFGNYVLSTIATNVDPTAFCNVFHVCEDKKISAEQGSMKCNICELAVNEAEIIIGNEKNEDAAIKKLDGVCDKIKFQFLHSECRDIVDNYLKSSIHWLINKAEPEVVCQKVHLCPAPKTVERSEANFQEIAPRVAADSAVSISFEEVAPVEAEPVKCAACEIVVTEVENIIGNEKNEDAAIKKLDGVCDKIKFQFLHSECRDIVDNYLKFSIHWLINKVKPVVVCQKVHLCPALKTVQRSEANFQEIAPRVAANSAVSISFEEVAPAEAEPVKCAVCEVVVTEVENIIGDEKNEDVVVKKLDGVCDKIESQFLRFECRLLVDKHLKQFVHLLISKVKPEVVCQKINLCPALKTVEKSVATIPKMEKKEGSVFECIICKLVIGEVEHIIGGNKTEEAILHSLDYVCDKLQPTFVKSHCRSFVDQHIIQIVDTIIDNANPEYVCHKLGGCSASLEVEKNDFHSKSVAVDPLASALFVEEEKSLASPRGNLKCSFCKVIVEDVEGLVGGNKTEEMVIERLDGICDELEVFKSQCRTFVERHLRKFVHLFLSELKPEVLCEEVGMCSAHSAEFSGVTNKCITCETVVQYLDALLETTPVIQQIESLVSRVCQLMPESFQPTCKSMIEEYGDLVVHYILHFTTPRGVCKFIHMCDASHERQHHKCIEGPQFWCESPENAKLCQAEEHCKEYVWVRNQ